MVTTRLMKAGEMLGIKVLDHRIVSDESFHSLRKEDEFSSI